MNILKVFVIVGGWFGGFRPAPLSYHDGVAALQLHRFRRVVVLERVDKVVLQVVLPQPVVFRVVPEQRRESLRLEHEARIVRFRLNAQDCVLRSRQKEVLLCL